MEPSVIKIPVAAKKNFIKVQSLIGARSQQATTSAVMGWLSGHADNCSAIRYSAKTGPRSLRKSAGGSKSTTDYGTVIP